MFSKSPVIFLSSIALFSFVSAQNNPCKEDGGPFQDCPANEIRGACNRPFPKAQPTCIRATFENGASKCVVTDCATQCPDKSICQPQSSSNSPAPAPEVPAASVAPKRPAEEKTSKLTTRAMVDGDQLSCLHHYGGFMKGGDNFPVIGAGDSLFANAKGCGQCIKITNAETGKSVVGMINDFCPVSVGCTSDQLDIAPVLSAQLGLTPVGKSFNNPDPSKISYVRVPCTDPGLNLGGKLRYFFGAGSKDTSLEMIILGGFYPITKVTMTVDGKPAEATREGGKWRFLSMPFLKSTSKIQFTTTFTQGPPVTDDVDISKITTGSGGGGFFKMGGKLDAMPGNKVHPDVFTWSDFVDGSSQLTA